MFRKRKQSKPTDIGRELCFGSRISRNRLISAGPKPRDYPGPFEHYQELGLLNKYPNKTGYTLLASKTPRDKDFRTTYCIAPPVGTYDVDVRKPPQQAPKPFGMGAKLAKDDKFVTPAPGTYTFFKRQVKICTAFNHDRIYVPLVKIICSPFNMAYCWKCEQTPIGDYWHKDSTNQDMCRPCMEKELADFKKCATKVLVRYRKVNELRLYTLRRYCEFFHEHNNTKAAVQQMSTKDLLFKLRKENYLASYGM